MDKDRIIEILDDWNFWKKERKIGIPRKEYISRLIALEKTGQVVVVSGVRRSGKSTILLQYLKHLIDSGVEAKNTLYVNFEEPRFAEELSLKLLQDIYECYLEYMEPAEKPYILLDEIHNVPKWEKFVRALHERDEARLFISGSSSKLLSKEFGTVLTGRHVDVIVYPLSFREFLEFRGVTVEKKLDVIRNRFKIKRFLKEYLEYGGFPKVVLSDEKRELLSRYFDDIINKDIVERHRLRKIEKLKSLGRYYLTNVASPVSFNRIKKFTSLPIDTVERFSYFLCEPYLIFFVKKFAYSLKEQEVNPRKVYCIDCGLRNVISFRFSEDIGKLYENLVFLELNRRGRGRDIYYWKNKSECDFVIVEGLKAKEAIQVCYRFDEETKSRELKGLLETMKKFKLKEGSVITEDYETEEKIEGKKIKYIPLWKWLLQ